MKIYIQSNDESLKTEFGKHATLSPIESADVIFMDLQSKISMKYFESNVKNKKRFIIFDRNLSINVNDANVLRKQNVILTEPALNFRRKYFHYVPFWIKIKDIGELELNRSKRPYDLIYKGNIQEKTQSFNEYYMAYAKAYPKTVYTDTYNNHGIIKQEKLEYCDSKVTIVIGTPLDYEIGYLDYSFFTALDCNCIPLVPMEHKYFSLLSPYKIDDKLFDINYIIEHYENSYIGYILDIYRTIDKYYPEMKVENVVKQVMDLL